jgi:hypothetical protein
MRNPLHSGIQALAVALFGATVAHGATNIILNGDFEQRAGNGPAGFTLSGAAEYRFLGDPNRDSSSQGISLRSDQPTGAVSCVVSNIDARQGRWFRFAFRGLPQANFAVASNDLFLKIEFFGQQGKISYDAKEKKIYDQVLALRKDLTVNGVRHQHGAEVWRTYAIDFRLPFPQVDQLRLSVGFGHGAASQSVEAAFFVDDLSLVSIPDPPNMPTPTALPMAIVPKSKLLPLGGRWFYAVKDGETTAPGVFTTSNVDRLLYHDNIYSAPFAGNTSAKLRQGDIGLDGSVVEQDRDINENVVIQFQAGAMVIRTHGIPNHPTGRFPEQGFGNPNYITEQIHTYYFPLDPAENPRHLAIGLDQSNSNHALPMGPIGLAVNGVVFFNPFDMGGRDATDLMDRCCGHPAPSGEYHYHKYPICVNSPWDDEGSAHSPLLGWAFDGFPLYGPYESDGVMAKDLKGDHALNEFNLHYDEARGWHYHVTPGKFPYLIGGYWGTRESRDGGPGGPRESRGGPMGAPSGPGRGRPPGFGGPPRRPSAG